MKRTRAMVGAKTHLTVLLLIALVCTFGAWAHFGMLNVVTDVVGEVVPSGQIKSVQHLEGGIVREILVREGDTVTKDQPLLTLEPTASGADVNELTVRITSLRVDIARLEAEVEGVENPTFPKDIAENSPRLVQEALDRFETRRSHRLAQINSEKETVFQRERQIEEISGRLANEREQLKLLQEQVTISENLMKRDLTTRMKHLGLLKEVAKLKGRIGEDQAALPRARSALKEASFNEKSVEARFKEDARKDLEEKRRNLDELTNRLAKYEDSLQRTVLRSPVDGVIKAVYASTSGGVIMPGATVVDVVPSGDRLVIEARMPPQEIVYVHAGQKAMIKLASANAARFGKIKGVVKQVSPDTMQTAEGRSFYKVLIETEQTYFSHRDERHQLIPGVQVISSIQTGTRTVMEYLLDPFMTTMERAMQEH